MYTFSATGHGMKFNPDIHQRRSIRLKCCDYTNAGAYFVTICTCGKEHLFGNITNREMRLNEFGGIVGKEWRQTGYIRKSLELDEFIVMPNHFHGIIILNEPVAPRSVNKRQVAHETKNPKDRAIHRIAPTTLQANSIGSIIGQFKSIVKKNINRIRNTPALPVWQRNYYERVIRNEYELQRIREYIIFNPLKWDEDEYHPDNL